MWARPGGNSQERAKHKKKFAFDEGPSTQIYTKQVEGTFVRWGT